MFGNHDYKTAARIAKEKSAELKKHCDVFPSEEEPGKFTIGVQVSFLTGDQFKKRIIERYRGPTIPCLPKPKEK